MGMREYSGSGYLIDLRIFKKVNKNEALSLGKMKELERKIHLLGLDEFWKEYYDDDSESYDYNFYDYTKEFNRWHEKFIYFSDIDNPEDFEYGVLYLYLTEDELYIKTKTELCEKLEENGINIEFGNYGFWG